MFILICVLCLLEFGAPAGFDNEEISSKLKLKFFCNLNFVKVFIYLHFLLFNIILLYEAFIFYVRRYHGLNSDATAFETKHLIQTYYFSKSAHNCFGPIRISALALGSKASALNLL